MLKYSKPVMKLSEIVRETGLPAENLRRIYGTYGQKVAWKQNPMKIKSPILFDTEELEKVRMKELETQNKAIRRDRGHERLRCIGR